MNAWMRAGILFGVTLLVTLLVMPLVALGQNAPAEDAAGTVTGVATYRERIAMPKNASFEATLADVSKMDTPAETIGTAVMENPGNPPYHFSISYDPRRIVENHTYAVRATIKIGDELAFTSDTTYPVITRGNGKEVNILLKSAGGRKTAPQKSDAPSARDFPRVSHDQVGVRTGSGRTFNSGISSYSHMRSRQR